MPSSNVIQCTDKDGISIACSKGTWDDHIVDEHPEMDGLASYVRTTIEEPYWIYQSATDARRKIFYRHFVFPAPLKLQFVRVVIEYKTARFRNKLQGYVVTSFLCMRIREGDILLWEE